MPRIGRVLAVWLGIAVGLTSAARAQGVRAFPDAPIAGATVSFDLSSSRLAATCPMLPSANGQTFAKPIAFSPETLPPAPSTPIALSAGARRLDVKFVFAHLAPGEYLLRD